MTYTYDAGGSMLRKQVFSGGSLSSTTDYIGSFVYTTASGTTTLNYVTMPEGRAMNTGGTSVSITPEYVITDPQGNARFSFENNGSGGITIRQENSYYGFGETFASNTVNPPTNPNKNLYDGGSEWETDLGNVRITNKLFTGITMPKSAGSLLLTLWRKAQKT